MKSEEQSRGQAKGFFTGRGVLSIRLSMCKERIWRAVWRSNMFLHQLAGRVGPIQLVRPVQLIAFPTSARRRVDD